MAVTRRDVLKVSSVLALASVPRMAMSAPAKITMTHAFSGANLEMLNELVIEFKKKNSEIDIDAILAGDNWSPLLQATLRAGLVGQLPDISHQSMTFTRILKKNNIAQPLDEALGGADAIAKIGIPAPVLRPMDGKLYCLPFGTALPVIYLNRDLLTKAGVDMTKPLQGWQEIIAAMARVNALGQPFNGGYIEYNADNGWIFQNLIAAMGGTILNADETDIAFENEVGLKALRLFREFGKAAGNSDMTRDQARQAFNGGSLGVLVRSASGLQSITQAAAGKFAFDVVSFPILADKGHLVGNVHGLMIFSKDADRQKAGAEYLKFATSAPGQAILAKMTGYLPANLAALEDKTYFGDYFTKALQLKTLVEALPKATDWETFPNNSKKIFDGWIEETRKVVIQEKEPEAALTAMAASARTLMVQNGQ